MIGNLKDAESRDPNHKDLQSFLHVLKRTHPTEESVEAFDDAEQLWTDKCCDELARIVSLAGKEAA